MMMRCVLHQNISPILEALNQKKLTKKTTKLAGTMMPLALFSIKMGHRTTAAFTTRIQVTAVNTIPLISSRNSCAVDAKQVDAPATQVIQLVIANCQNLSIQKKKSKHAGTTMQMAPCLMQMGPLTIAAGTISTQQTVETTTTRISSPI